MAEIAVQSLIRIVGGGTNVSRWRWRVADHTLSYHLNVKTLLEPGDLYAGYDVGRKHDLSVLVVLERINKEFRWRGAVELREAPFDEQFELLTSVLKVRGLRRLAIDQSGLGMQLAEDLVREHRSRVEPISVLPGSGRRTDLPNSTAQSCVSRRWREAAHRACQQSVSCPENHARLRTGPSGS